VAQDAFLAWCGASYPGFDVGLAVIKDLVPRSPPVLEPALLLLTIDSKIQLQDICCGALRDQLYALDTQALQLKSEGSEL
jgi:hypothetical protein